MTVDLRDLAQPGDFITAERWNEMQIAIYGHIRDEVAALQAQIDARGAARVAGGGVSREIEQSGHGFSVGDAIYYHAADSAYRLARSDVEATTGMFLVSEVPDDAHFTLLQAGHIRGLTRLVPGEFYFVSAETSGALALDEPVHGVSNPILLADSTTSGYVLPYRPSEVADGDVQAIFDLVRPVGDTFVQWFGAMDPNELFNRGGIVSEWVDTDVPPGCFVRAAGGEANVGVSSTLTGEVQPHQMQSHKHEDLGHVHDIHPPFRNQQWPQVGADGYAIILTAANKQHDDGRASAMTGYTNLSDPTDSDQEGTGPVSHGVETRPRNVAVVFWKRIA